MPFGQLYWVQDKVEMWIGMRQDKYFYTIQGKAL